MTPVVVGLSVYTEKAELLNIKSRIAGALSSRWIHQGTHVLKWAENTPEAGRTAGGIFPI